MKFWPARLTSRQTLPVTKVPIAPEAVARAVATMHFRRTWTCGCGASITIRGRTDRQDGPSNYVVFAPNHPKAGCCRLDADLLNWNGLLEERGWRPDPVTCPACQRGLAVGDYKRLKSELAALRMTVETLVAVGETTLSQQLSATVEQLRRQVEG